MARTISVTSHPCSKRNWKKKHPSFKSVGPHGRIIVFKHLDLHFLVSKVERMAHCMVKTFWSLNILIGSILANIDSRMGILSLSVGPNLWVRKPSKGSCLNEDQRVYALLLDNVQKICEKAHGDLIEVPIALRMIVCKKRSRCSILLRAIEARFCAMFCSAKFTIRKKTLQCHQRSQVSFIALNASMLNSILHNALLSNRQCPVASPSFKALQGREKRTLLWQH